MAGLVTPEMLNSQGGKKVYGDGSAELADMNLQLQQVFMDKVRTAVFWFHTRPVTRACTRRRVVHGVNCVPRTPTRDAASPLAFPHTQQQKSDESQLFESFGTLFPNTKQINELPEDEKAGFIGKMHSPEMQEKIKTQFTSEKFQDHIDKMEAEQGAGDCTTLLVPLPRCNYRLIFFRSSELFCSSEHGTLYPRHQ